MTDKNVTRYFMSIPEAVGLALETNTFSSNGDVFFLDMGKPIKILDIAKKMIRLNGLDYTFDQNDKSKILITLQDFDQVKNCMKILPMKIII